MIHDKITIPTDHFFKFLAIFGLVATLFCISFPFLFLKPYNDLIEERNFLIAELEAQEGYYEGIIYDLEQKIPDSIMISKKEYAWKAGENKSDPAFYIPEPSDTILNSIIQKFNSQYLELAKVKFKMTAIRVSNKTDKKNINIHQYLNVLFTFFSFLLMFRGMILWHNYQRKLDKYQEDLQSKLELEINSLKNKPGK